MIKILIIITTFISFNWQLFASVAEKPAIESCIQKSAGKIIIPNDASFPTFSVCHNTNCLTIPDGFSCITHKLDGDKLVVDATKKSNFDKQKAQSDLLAQVVKDSQIFLNVKAFCLYEFNDSDCKGISPTSKAKIKSAFGELPPKVKTKLGL